LPAAGAVHLSNAQRYIVAAERAGLPAARDRFDAGPAVVHAGVLDLEVARFEAANGGLPLSGEQRAVRARAGHGADTVVGVAGARTRPSTCDLVNRR
jgi:hypothetical protein